MCCKTVKNLRNGCMEKHREIYEGLRPLKSTCCEDSDSQPNNQQRSYLLNTKLSDGRSALLLDIGSVGNLMSYEWARIQAVLALGQGFRSKEKKRDSPLKISGVGHGHQVCEKDGVVPVCLKDTEGHI